MVKFRLSLFVFLPPFGRRDAGVALEGAYEGVRLFVPALGSDLVDGQRGRREQLFRLVDTNRIDKGLWRALDDSEHASAEGRNRHTEGVRHIFHREFAGSEIIIDILHDSRQEDIRLRCTFLLNSLFRSFLPAQLLHLYEQVVEMLDLQFLSAPVEDIRYQRHENEESADDQDADNGPEALFPVDLLEHVILHRHSKLGQIGVGLVIVDGVAQVFEPVAVLERRLGVNPAQRLAQALARVRFIIYIMLRHEDRQGFVVILRAFDVPTGDIEEVPHMVIGDSEGVVIARRFDNRHSLGEFFLGFVVAFEDDERSRALRPADSRFIQSAQFLLDFQRLRSIIERLFRHLFTLVHLGRHAVDDRFAGHIIRIFDIINSPQDIFLRLVRLPHGHIDTREGVIGRSYNIGVPALDIQSVAILGIKQKNIFKSNPFTQNVSIINTSNLKLLRNILSEQ